MKAIEQQKQQIARIYDIHNCWSVLFFKKADSI